ncbi:UNVERIFIED_ORG: hypothetical protein ABID57_001326 [Arthrobacter sp. UYEF1]
MKHALTSLWLRVQEPRKQSAVYFAVYLLTTTLGGAILIDPPRSLQGTIGQVLVMIWAGMLVLGGGTGLATVLQGWWWLERAGTVLCGFAMVVCGIAIGALPVSQVSMRLVTICLMMLALLLFVARLLKTRHYSYDPEK